MDGSIQCYLVQDDIGVEDEYGGRRGAQPSSGRIAGFANRNTAVDVISQIVLSHVLISVKPQLDGGENCK